MKIYILIIVAFISFIVYGVFNQNRIDPKVKRVACQNSVTTFEKIYSTDLKFAKELLLSSNYIIESKIEYSKSMKSNLYNIFSNKQSDQILNDVLSKFKNSDKKYDKKLLISKPSPFVNTNLDFLFIPTIYATPSSTSLAL